MGHKWSDRTPVSVLFVDGDKSSRESFARALEDAGFRVFKAATGTEAWGLLPHVPDLILLGVKPPDINGIEVFRRLKTDPATSFIPVIQLLGRNSRAVDLTGGMEEGADAYLNKTAKPKELIAAIKVFLRIRRAEQTATGAAQQWQASGDMITEGPGHTGRGGRSPRQNPFFSKKLARNPAELYDRLTQDLVAESPGPVKGLPFAPRREVICRELNEDSQRDRWYQVTVEPAVEGRDDMKCSVQVWTEVSEPKQAEALAEQRDQAFRSLADNLPDIVVRFDRQLRYVFGNRRMEQLTGLGQAAFLGRTNAELGMAEDLVARWDEKLHQVFASNQPLTFEFGFPTLEGPQIFEASLTPEAGPDGTPATVLGVIQEVTDRKRLESQLQQAHKMELLGRLASGVAHDFNNLLTIILGYGEILGVNLPNEAPARDALKQILRAGERAALLTRQLLAFSRKQPPTPVVLDLNTLVADMERMLSRLIGENIDLIISLDPDLGWVKGDRGQLEQVILNLAVNARDAMDKGGRLVIATQQAMLEPKEGHSAGPHVVITVSDNGCGMDDQTKSRIFERFFTLKDPGKGTGLGLATVLEIVQASGGRIEVESELGQGSTFKIYLPQVEESLAPDALPAGQPIVGGSETILVVEDECEIRNLANHSLQTHGYKVLVARSAEEALQASQISGPVHLLVSDVILPQMSGPELADQLTKGQPELKVLFLSGYSEDAIGRLRLLAKSTPFLQKPFAPATLLRKVREVLDGPATE